MLFKIWFYFFTNRTMWNECLVKLFLDAKKVEWCSIRRILYYGMILKNVLESINLNIQDITTDELRN